MTVTWHDLLPVRMVQKMSLLMAFTIPHRFSSKKSHKLYTFYATVRCVSVITIWITCATMGLNTTAKVLFNSAIAITHVVSIVNPVIFKRTRMIAIGKLTVETMAILKRDSGCTFDFGERRLSIVCFLVGLVSFSFIWPGCTLYSPAINVYHLALRFYDGFEFALVFVAVLQIYCDVSLVHVLVKTLNRELEATRVHFDRCCQTYKRLCRLVSLINDVYGQQIFMLLVTSVVCPLAAFENYLKRAFLASNYTASTNWLLSLQIFTITMMYVSVLAYKCHQTMTEAKKTASISYKLYLNYPLVSKSDEETRIKDQLLWLSQGDLTNSQMRFNAMDLMLVDYNLIYTIVGTIISYTILLLQLK